MRELVHLRRHSYCIQETTYVKCTMVKYKLHVCFFQRDIFKATVNAGQYIGDTKISPWDTSLSNVCVTIRATAFEIFCS